MQVDWIMCKGNIWCELNKVDTDHKNLVGEQGVYIIWSGKEAKNILRIGSGIIRSEILKNQKDIAMLAFFHVGVYVTWAEVGNKKDNVVAYLQQKLHPKFMDNPSKASPVNVNLPWDPVVE
jgi:hypothetical protein